MNIRHVINDNPMSRLQIVVVMICLILNMLDGFDVLVIAFTAPALAEEWGLSHAELGALFSAGLTGMMIGAFFISPLADKIGRRPVVLFSLILVTLGMFASSIMQAEMTFALSRLVTGLGIGGMLASINTVVSEYSNNKSRNMALSLMHVGYPVGAIVAGIFSAYAIQHLDWRAVYVLGGTASLVMIPIVYFWMPESLDFLLSGKAKNTLPKINHLLAKLGCPPIASMSLSHEISKGQYSGPKLLFKNHLKESIFLWLAFFMIMTSLYFLLNWTPKLLIDLGMSLKQGISSGVIMNIGGIVGMVCLGLLTSRFPLVLIVRAYVAVAAALIILLGMLKLPMFATMIVVGAAGFCVMGALIGIYMIGAWIYSPTIRTTGVGWAITFGRLGAILGPFIAGIMIDANVGRGSFYTAFAVPLMLTAVFLGYIKIKQKD